MDWKPSLCCSLLHFLCGLYTTTKACHNASESTVCTDTRGGRARRRSDPSSYGKQKKTSELRIHCLNIKDTRFMKVCDTSE